MSKSNPYFLVCIILLMVGCFRHNNPPNFAHTQPETIYVFGKFDLDRDGEPDPDGYKLITDIVKRIGHNAADELNNKVTLIVLGIEPDTPVRPTNEQDLTLLRKYRSALDSYHAYQNFLRTTADLGIPVINQTRFLDQAGFFAE